MLLLPHVPGITVDLGAKLGMMHQQEGKPIMRMFPMLKKYRIIVEGFNAYNIPVALRGGCSPYGRSYEEK